MKYVLDTDILVYFFKNDKNIFEKISTVPPSQLATTIFNETELLYGAFNSERIEQNIKKINETMKDIEILEFSRDASLIFAENKAALKKKGSMLHDMDLLIASVTLANHSVLVTNNTKHFERIRGLKLENWMRF